jgi:uncharacterized membrane protein
MAVMADSDARSSGVDATASPVKSDAVESDAAGAVVPQPRVEGPSGSGHLAPDAVAAAVKNALHLHLGEHLAKIEELMGVAGRRALHQGEKAVPAWLRPTAGEPRWPVAFTVLAAIGLQFAVPSRLVVHPVWLLPGVELLLLALLIAANPRRINRDHRLVRVGSLTLVAVATLANVWTAVHLIEGLINGSEREGAALLLGYGAAIWATNVIVFALWYWEFDRGGPLARAKATRVHPDFQFAQMQSPDLTHDDWEPAFLDYLYLSFTNATAFSPTDTLPLSRWAKMAMLAQSCVSLVTVALVVARAVNVLGT